MAVILQTTFSNVFSLMKMYKFRLRFHWSLFPRVQSTIFQHLFRWWLGAGQVTSHCLNQCWYVLLMHICVTWPQWSNVMSEFWKTWSNISESWLNLGLRPANERHHCKVMPSLIGWAQTFNQPWEYCAQCIIRNVECRHGPCFNIKTSVFHYRNFRYKDEMVSWLILMMGMSIPGKMVFILEWPGSRGH